MYFQSSCPACVTHRSLHSRFISFVIAILSRRNEILGKNRLTICITYNKKIVNKKLELTECEMLVKKGEKMFCGACECPMVGPMSYFSELKRKTGYSKAECPIERW